VQDLFYEVEELHVHYEEVKERSLDVALVFLLVQLQDHLQLPLLVIFKQKQD
jgi:hypothetical protein